MKIFIISILALFLAGCAPALIAGGLIVGSALTTHHHSYNNYHHYITNLILNVKNFTPCVLFHLQVAQFVNETIGQGRLRPRLNVVGRYRDHKKLTTFHGKNVLGSPAGP